MTLESPHQVTCEAGSVYRQLVFSPVVMREIAQRATAQFLALPRGGLEVGGLLYGVRDGDSLRITDHRELEIEYLTGPSFALSENDEAALRALLQSEAPGDVESEGLEVVGWWHSHTRSDLSFTDADMAVHRKFFRAAGSVGLVVKPYKFEPAEFALYTPHEQGTAPCGTFTLPKRPSVEPRELLPVDEPSLEVTRAIATSVAAPEPLRVEPLTPWRDNAALIPPERGRKGLVAIVMSALLALAVAGFLFTRPAAPGPMRLDVTNAADKLNVRWNADDRRVSDAAEAQLLIADGTATPTTVNLRVEDLRSGTLTYVRKSDRVQFRLRVRSRTGAVEEAVALFVGTDPPAREVAATPAAPVDQEKVEPSQPAAPEQISKSRAAEPSKPDVNSRLKEVPKVESSALNPNLPPPPPAVVERSRTQAVPPSNIAAATTPSPAGSGAPEPVVPAPVTAQTTAPAVSDPGPSRLILPPAPVPAGRGAVISDPAARTASARPVAPVRPARGRAIWTGHLSRGSVLAIENRRVSMGDLTGRMPSRECRVRVYGGELRDSGLVVYTGSGPERVEPPSAANGWNVTTFRPDSKRSRDVSVVEAPSQSNNWQRLIVRGERPVSVLVIDWEEVGN